MSGGYGHGVVRDELNFIMFERALLCSYVYRVKIPLQTLRDPRCISALPSAARSLV
jgi:hypothetical protein